MAHSVHPNIDFRMIRPFDGRQGAGFEEFCCQVAFRAPGLPEGSRFERYDGAGGDGGVECLWKLPDGTEWGWQAKYLFNLQAAQLTKSVKTALDIHPHLTRYTVCLPFNFTGPTGRPGQSQGERFDKLKQEWQELARKRNMNVQFEHMGKTMLLDALLSFDADHARLRFWFDTYILGPEWFSKRLEDAIADAGPRYTPSLSVEVPIVQAFEAFGRTPAWAQVEEQRRQQLDLLSDSWSRTLIKGDWLHNEADFPGEATSWRSRSAKVSSH